MEDQPGRTGDAPLQKSIKLIEELLGIWNIPPDSVKDPNNNIWYLTQGSAKFHIELFKYNKGEKFGEVDCVEIGGMIMQLPAENLEALCKRLLELNSTAVGVYFAIRKNLVMLLATREVEGMDLNELKTLVDEVRIFADYWDDILMDEFKGTK